MTTYCPTVSVTWRMLKLCENCWNIDYLYETSSVLRKATETEILGSTLWLRFKFLKTETKQKFGFCTSLISLLLTQSYANSYSLQDTAPGSAPWTSPRLVVRQCCELATASSSCDTFPRVPLLFLWPLNFCSALQMKFTWTVVISCCPSMPTCCIFLKHNLPFVNFKY